jgi:hypothetical protein
MGIGNDIQVDDDVKPTEIPLTTTTTTAAAMTTEATKMSTSVRTLKLEDYDEITFDPALVDDDNKNSEDEEDLNAANRVRRESENDEESTTTTALDSSTIISREEDTVADASATVVVGSSSNHVVTTVLQLPQLKPPQEFHNSTSQTTQTNNNNNNQFPYPASSNSHAEYIFITTHKPPAQPLRNYYDFYPSQPDFHYHRNYYYNFIPLYGTSTQYPHKSASAFVPIASAAAFMSPFRF